MEVTMIHRSDLVITSKETALEFYNGVKSCILIPYTEKSVIRIEPNNQFSIISKTAISSGTAWMIPSVYDDDGSIAYRHRKYINAYLRRGEE